MTNELNSEEMLSEILTIVRNLESLIVPLLTNPETMLREMGPMGGMLLSMIGNKR